MVCGVVELCRIIPCAQKYNKGFRAVLDAFLTKKSEQHILFNILLRWVMKRLIRKAEFEIAEIKNKMSNLRNFVRKEKIQWRGCKGFLAIWSFFLRVRWESIRN